MSDASGKRYIQYIAENVFEHEEDVKNILDIASKECYRQLSIHSPELETFGVIFSVFLRNLVKKLTKKSRAGSPTYVVSVAKRFEIGYDNATDDNFQESGCFMVFMKHLYNDNPTFDKVVGEKTITLCSMWNTENVQTDSTFIKECATDTIGDLKNYDLKLQSMELIVPIVSIVYDSMVSYIRIKRAESKEFEETINMMSLFKIVAQAPSGTETNDFILFIPSNEFKMTIKSDKHASTE